MVDHRLQSSVMVIQYCRDIVVHICERLQYHTPGVGRFESWPPSLYNSATDIMHLRSRIDNDIQSV